MRALRSDFVIVSMWLLLLVARFLSLLAPLLGLASSLSTISLKARKIVRTALSNFFQGTASRHVRR
jgi:hypothetical protein